MRDFSAAAARYAAHAIIQRQMLEALLEGVDLHEEKILDAGAGPAVVAPLLPKNCHVIALDRAEGMMQLASSIYPAVVADITAIPFAPASFDGVLCNAVLHWVQDMIPTLQQFRTVTKPGGKLLLGCFVEGTLAPLKRAYLNADLTPKVIEFPSDMGLTQAIEKSGWQIDMCRVEKFYSDHANLAALLRHFKDIGARDHRMQAMDGLMTPRMFEALSAAYDMRDAQGQVRAPWVVKLVHASAV